MLKGIQSLGQGQRIVVFATLFIGGLLAIIALTVLLYMLSLNATPRTAAVALTDALTVREFAALPDADAFPSTVAVGADGRVYTGSYASGAVWVIDPNKPLQTLDTDGDARIEADRAYVVELPNTRDLVGSVRGLAVTPDGTLYILDGISSDPRGAGGTVWRIESDGQLTDLGGIRHEAQALDESDESAVTNRGFLSPKDIEADALGNLYVTDRGWREVWKYDAATGERTLFWKPADDDTEAVPTGLAYDRANNALIVTDSEANSVYSVDLVTGQGTMLYRYDQTRNAPGFSGAAFTPDGTLYITTLDQNGVVRIENGALVYVVGTLRGASDIAASADGKLYLTNFDSAGLVRPDTRPQLPFALDVVTFNN